MTAFTRYAIKDNKDGTFGVVEAVSRPYQIVMWLPIGGSFQSRETALAWIKEEAKKPQPTLEYFNQLGEPWHKS